MPQLNGKEKSENKLIELMKSRQLFDGTFFRSKSFELESVKEALTQLALRIGNVLMQLPQTDKTDHPGDPEIDKPRAAQIAPTTTMSVQAAPVTEPVLRVVDPRQGPYRTLADALAAAQAGDRIVVRPGIYNGGLVIHKPLEIVGEGNPAEIVIAASGANTLAFRTMFGRIANITVRQCGGDDFVAVDITQGHLILEGCRIESAGLAGIAVHGHAAAPIVRNNRIQRCVKSGVVIFDHARGVLEENEIAENGAIGVVLRAGASAILRSNRIGDNDQAGVFADGAAGVLEDNTIFSSQGEGVLVANHANPILRRNRISKNARAGIYVYDSGAGTITGNKIVDNLNSGIAIRADGNPVIRENAISRNNGKGVWCRDGAAGVVEDNDLRGNGFGAFWKSDDCTTRYTGNQE